MKKSNGKPPDFDKRLETVNMTGFEWQSRQNMCDLKIWNVKR